MSKDEIEKLIFRLAEIKKWHYIPNHAGDMGEMGQIIDKLEKHFKAGYAASTVKGERLFTVEDLEDCWDACEKYHLNEMKHYSDKKNVAGKKEYLKAVIKNNKPNE